jgi:hypothetical protein
MILFCVNLFSWDFDYNQLSSNETELTNKLIKIGEPHGLGLELAAIGIVETRLGKFESNNKYICGIHQINTRIAMKRIGSNGNKNRLCEELNINENLSSIFALNELIYWKKYTKNNISQMITNYNSGFEKSSHSKEYLRRFNIVYNELKRLNATEG